MKMEPPYTELKDLLRKIWEWWDENGKTRERIGELIDRMGMGSFLRDMGLKPAPQMVFQPRSNPYYFWQPTKSSRVSPRAGLTKRVEMRNG